MSQPIDGKSPKQQCVHEYGTDIRYIRGLLASALNANRGGQKDCFTKDDLDLIQEICINAEERAKAKYNEARRSLDTTLPATSLGTSTESREYTGK